MTTIDTTPAAQTYWAMAAHYTIGTAFATRRAAFAEAALRLSRYMHLNETTDRLIPLKVTVDERVKDHTGDRPVRRFTLTVSVNEEEL